ncbi:MAG: DUF308 domain-containing protein [Phycisphaerales bacterium]
MPSTPSVPSSGPLADVLPHIPGRVLALGVLLVILGVLSMTLPQLSGLAVALIVGAVLIVAGVTRIVAGLNAPSLGAGTLHVLLGLLMLLAGAFMLLNPWIGLAKLTLIAAIYFGADGIAEIFTSFRIRPRKGWGLLLLNGLVTLLLGVLIWREWPLSGEWAVGILVGVQLLFTGFQLIALGSAAKQLAAAR